MDQIIENFEVHKSGIFEAPVETGMTGIYTISYHHDNLNFPFLNYEKFHIPLYIGQAPLCFRNRIYRFLRELLGSSTAGDGLIDMEKQEIYKEMKSKNDVISDVGAAFHMKFKRPMGHSAANLIRKYMKPKVHVLSNGNFIFPGLRISLEYMDKKNVANSERVEIAKHLPFFNTQNIPKKIKEVRKFLFHTPITLYTKDEIRKEYLELREAHIQFRKDVKYV